VNKALETKACIGWWFCAFHFTDEKARQVAASLALSMYQSRMISRVMRIGRSRWEEENLFI
jgi:hypothetical protein